MSQQVYSTNDTKTLANKIKSIRVAMMTTEEPDGTLHSRPMATQDREFDGYLWFFTLASAPKVGEVEQHRQVNLSYTKPEDNLFVSVSGTAELVRDRQKIQEFWRPFYRPWFPKGEDDPDLALLKVDVQNAEYWDAPAGRMGTLYMAAKKMATGDKGMAGENRKLDIK
jgi:general stress protein 26